MPQQRARDRVPCTGPLHGRPKPLLFDLRTAVKEQQGPTKWAKDKCLRWLRIKPTDAEDGATASGGGAAAADDDTAAASALATLDECLEKHLDLDLQMNQPFTREQKDAGLKGDPCAKFFKATADPY